MRLRLAAVVVGVAFGMSAAPASAQSCQANASLFIQATPVLIEEGAEVALEVCILNTSFTQPFPGEFDVPALLKGTTSLALACLDPDCASQLPGTLTFQSCVTTAAGVASCARDVTNANLVTIVMTPQGADLEPGEAICLATIVAEAAAISDFAGVVYARASTGPTDLEIDPVTCPDEPLTGDQDSLPLRFSPRPGDVLIVDSDADALLRFNPADGNLVKISDTPSGAGDAAPLVAPTDVVVDGDGTILISDAGDPNLRDGAIRRFDAETGGAVTLEPPSPEDNTLFRPFALTSIEGTLYVADAGPGLGGANGRVVRLRPTIQGGAFGARTVWEQEVVLDQGTLVEPRALAVDARGKIWIADQGEIPKGPAGAIYRLDPETGAVAAIDPGLPEGWQRPRGIGIDRDDTIVVFDSGFQTDAARIVRLFPLDDLDDPRVVDPEASEVCTPSGGLRPNRLVLTPQGDLLSTRLVPAQTKIAQVDLSPEDPSSCEWQEIPTSFDSLSEGSGITIVPTFERRDLLVADMGDNGAGDGRVVRIRGGEAEEEVDEEDFGVGELDEPVGVVLDRTGALALVDAETQAVRSIDPQSDGAPRDVSKELCISDPQAITTGQRGQLLVFDPNSVCQIDTVTVNPRTGEQAEDEAAPGIILDTGVPTMPDGGAPVAHVQFAAASFRLRQETRVTEVALYINWRGSESPVYLYLTRSLGEEAEPADVISQRSFSEPYTGYYDVLVDDEVLDAGTYFVVVASAALIIEFGTVPFSAPNKLSDVSLYSVGGLDSPDTLNPFPPASHPWALVVDPSKLDPDPEPGLRITGFDCDSVPEACLELMASERPEIHAVRRANARSPALRTYPPDGIFCDARTGDFFKAQGSSLTVQPGGCLAGRAVNDIGEIQIPAGGFEGFQSLLFVVTDQNGDIFTTDFGAEVIWRLAKGAGDYEWETPERHMDADKLGQQTGNPNETFTPLGICVLDETGEVNVADASPAAAGKPVRIVRIASNRTAQLVDTSLTSPGGMLCVERERPAAGRATALRLEDLDVHPGQAGTSGSQLCPEGDGSLDRDDAMLAAQVALGLVSDFNCPGGAVDPTRLDVAPPAATDEEDARICPGGENGEVTAEDALILHRTALGLLTIDEGLR